MTKNELYAISGGAFNWNSTVINALSRGINTILDAGRTLGTVIRMVATGRKC